MHTVEPESAAVRAMCNDLRTMVEGLKVLGLHPFKIEHAIKMLNDQALEIERLHSDENYVLGRKDGFNAAMATGVWGENSSGVGG